MRDEYLDDYYAADDEGQQGWRGRFAERASTWIGAALALVLIAGLVVWAYGLGRRDASDIPVLRAALQPAKMQPDDPGGAVIAYQDITSYDIGQGAGAPPEITFAPPSERPAEADVAMGTLQETIDSMVLTANAEAAAVAAAAEAAAEATGETPTGPDASALAPTVSRTAPLRPTNLSQKMAAAQTTISAEAELAARAAASTVQIQLGAYPDREMTRSEWARIYRSNEDILSGRTLVVQSTISGGRRFFRLRAGPFTDRVEAQNICRALQARGMDCLVAVNG